MSNDRRLGSVDSDLEPNDESSIHSASTPPRRRRQQQQQQRRRTEKIKPEINPNLASPRSIPISRALAKTNIRHHPKPLRGTTEQICAPSKRKSPHTWLWCLQGSILPLALIALHRCRLASRTKTKTLSSRKVLGTPRLYEGMCKSESPVTTKGANVSLPVFRM